MDRCRRQKQEIKEETPTAGNISPDVAIAGSNSLKPSPDEAMRNERFEVEIMIGGCVYSIFLVLCTALLSTIFRRRENHITLAIFVRQLQPRTVQVGIPLIGLCF